MPLGCEKARETFAHVEAKSLPMGWQACSSAQDSFVGWCARVCGLLAPSRRIGLVPLTIDSTIAAALAASGIVLALIGIFLAAAAGRRLARLEHHYGLLMQDVEGDDLAAALETYVTRLGSADKRLHEAEQRITGVETRLRRAVQHVAVSRYKAFADAGGDQSFTIALADDIGDGVVVTGLHARGGVRIYAKPLLKGRSSYALTSEEEEAVTEALKQTQNG